ncbi:hypothetical protein AC579_10309 [Pseudocercospora musae]|uniref:Metallo-beta-lactamase domain-containing protein n=1 Tax=Pseudocercospora musae TaxID=113226 RepID=A0A139I2K4_9PEZI|nr:hypothetical protein AC579_10309 [Pseudocercospora musae]
MLQSLLIVVVSVPVVLPPPPLVACVFHGNMEVLEEEDHSSSFHVQRINGSTFCIRENDAFGEHPLIYAKVHTRAPVIVLSDTGCDEPRDGLQHSRFIHLRRFLEECPVACNGDKPLNPAPCKRKYIIICSHCHYDHISGITQFLEGGETQIIASAAGRDFIESDLETHGLFKFIGRVAPWYQVTKWVQAFEKLWWQIDASRKLDLGITFIQTPGHTPDSLAFYDHKEMHLYVGDSLYEEGQDGMAIIWPPHGNMVEWAFSMQKLQYFVKSENARALVKAKIDAEAESDDDLDVVEQRVKLAAGHQTHNADAEDILGRLEKLFVKALRNELPVTKKEYHLNEAYYTWREVGWGMHFSAPARLMDEARSFFRGTGIVEKGWSFSLSSPGVSAAKPIAVTGILA